MAGSRVNNYSPSTTDLTSVMATIDAERLGYIGASLTNYSTTSVPAIASGSMVEVAGALYSFSTDEPISTTGVASTAAAIWHVRLVPSSSQCTAQFSTTSPTWRTDYQGWYYSTASADKYLQYITYFDGTNYNYKCAGNRDTHSAPTAIFVSGISSSMYISSATHVSTAPFVLFNYYKTLDVLGELSTTTGVFTPTQSGYYKIDGRMFVNYANIGIAQILYNVRINGAYYSSNRAYQTVNSTGWCYSFQAIAGMNRNDTLDICLFASSGDYGWSIYNYTMCIERIK